MSSDVELNRLLLDQLADKWTILVLHVFCDSPEPVRFNEIKRRVQGVSQKTLTQCLRRLERNGILERRIIQAAPLGVEYSITPLGWTMEEPFRALQRWAEKHLPEMLQAQARFDGRVQKSASVEQSEVA
jgi:DNA-binding HxlR family transcriptional regulator